MGLTVKYTKNEAVPESTYRARLDGVKQVNNQFGDSIQWTFTIVEPAEHANKTVTGMTSTKLSAKSKMYGWLQAFGVSVGPNDAVDLESLLGRTCRIKIKNNTKSQTINEIGRAHV